MANADIAKELGYKNAHVVCQLLSDAGRKGWFNTADIEEHLTYVTSHKIVKNVDADLDDGSLLPGQREMTIAAAKGRGLFKSYEGGRNEATAPPMILGVKIEVVNQENVAHKEQLPPVKPVQRISEESGTPMYTEGEVVATQSPELGRG